LKNRLGISAHVAVAVPFALLAACGSSSSGGGTSGMDATSDRGGAGAGGAAGSQAGGAGSGGTAGIGGQSCSAWIACCSSLGDTGCVSAAQALEALAATGKITEAALEMACQGNLKILVTGHECEGTGGSGDGGTPPGSDGGAGGSTGGGIGGMTGSAGAGGAGGAGGAAWTCIEGAGNCACETYPLYPATSCSAGPYSCCKEASARGIDVCTCTNTITAANCAAASGGAMVAHCPP
jgi:hypothetical protein